MKWFLSRRVPAVTRILLIESGPRSVAEKALPRLRQTFGAHVPIDLLTCLPTDPVNYWAEAPINCFVWRVTEQTKASGRWRLLCQIRAKKYPVTAILCANNPIMSHWKKAALLLLPSKFLVVNKSADFFWIDRGHWAEVLQFLLNHAGFFDEFTVRTLTRVLAFPLTFVYLLTYALYVHTVRLARRALGIRSRSKLDLEKALD